MTKSSSERRRKMQDICRESVRIVSAELGVPERLIDVSSDSYRDSILSGFVGLLDYLEKNSGPLDKIDAVDLGVGKGWSTRIFSEYFHSIRGYDLEHTISEQIGLNIEQGQHERIWRHYADRKNMSLEHFDGYHLVGVQDASIDVVIAEAVFEHVGDNALGNAERETWLREVARVLKTNGVLYISECPSRYSYAEFLAGMIGMGNHQKRFGRRELVDLVEKCGFRMARIERNHPFIDFYPGFLMAIWNLAYRGVFRWLEPLLLLTPFKLVAHHYRFIAVKV